MPNVAVHRAEQREVAVGDRIRFTANDYGLGVVNGQSGTVEAIDQVAGELEVDVGSERALTLDMNRPLRVDHAYCTTVHAAQGQTCDRVLVDADVSGAMANQSLYYVATFHSFRHYWEDTVRKAVTADAQNGRPWPKGTVERISGRSQAHLEKVEGSSAMYGGALPPSLMKPFLDQVSFDKVVWPKTWAEFQRS